MKFLQIFREWRELDLQPVPHRGNVIGETCQGRCSVLSPAW